MHTPAKYCFELCEKNMLYMIEDIKKIYDIYDLGYSLINHNTYIYNWLFIMSMEEKQKATCKFCGHLQKIKDKNKKCGVCLKKGFLEDGNKDAGGQILENQNMNT